MSFMDKIKGGVREMTVTAMEHVAGLTRPGSTINMLCYTHSISLEGLETYAAPYKDDYGVEWLIRNLQIKHEQRKAMATGQKDICFGDVVESAMAYESMRENTSGLKAFLLAVAKGEGFEEIEIETTRETVKSLQHLNGGMKR